MLLSLHCTFDRSNPLDENGPKYIAPQIIIKEESSVVKNLDTINFDTITIVLEGNREESIFNLKVEDGDWVFGWQRGGIFGFGKLTDGEHTLYVNSMYLGGELVVSDSITFYVLTKGYKPEFDTKTDSVVHSFIGKSVTLATSAKGEAPLHYLWLKDTSVLTGKETATLTLDTFSLNDTATYRCIVSNAYGKDTSGVYTLKYRPFTGGVKGVIVGFDEVKLKSVQVTLLPSNKRTETDADGSFEIKGLTADTCSLKITLSGYYDTTLNSISVNDSEMIDLKSIRLTKIGTLTYKVTYNGNGNDSGNVPVDTNKYKPGSIATVADNTGDLFKTGYTFSKWNTQQNGKGISFSAADTFSMPDSTVVLFAQWSALPTYKVTYNKNNADSGLVPVDNNSYYKGKTVTIMGNPGKLYRNGYSFAGWNTTPDGNGDTYNAGSKFSMPDSVMTFM